MINQLLKNKDLQFGLQQEHEVLSKIRKHFKDDTIQKNPDEYGFLDFYSMRKDGTMKYKIELKSRKPPYYMDVETHRAYSKKTGYELRTIIFGNNKMDEYRYILTKNPKCHCYILFNMYDKTFKKQNLFYYRITLNKINNKFNIEWIKEPNVWNKVRNDTEKNTNVGIKTEYIKPLSAMSFKKK